MPALVSHPMIDGIEEKVCFLREGSFILKLTSWNVNDDASAWFGGLC